MIEKREIASTTLLAGWVQSANLTPMQQTMIYDMISFYRDQFEQALKTMSPAELMEAVYANMDKLEQNMHPEAKAAIRCKKGCSFCCYIDVAVTPPEIAIIKEYCKKNNITISKANGKACVFLRNGVCSIYPVRPMSCRKYFVASKPKFCDTEKYLGRKVANHVEVEMETMTSALFNMYPIQVTLKEMMTGGMMAQP